MEEKGSVRDLISGLSSTFCILTIIYFSPVKIKSLAILILYTNTLYLITLFVFSLKSI